MTTNSLNHCTCPKFAGSIIKVTFKDKIPFCWECKGAVSPTKPVFHERQSEISDIYKLTQRIEESLAYFCDEFPKSDHPSVWIKPISYHCGGITPDDLQTLLSILYARKPVSVSLEKCVKAAASSSNIFEDEAQITAADWIVAKAVLDAAGVKYVD